MENQRPEAPSDDLDLGKLFAKVGEFFAQAWLVFMRFIAVLRSTPINNKVLFASLVVIGGVTAFAYSSFLKRKFYASSMILSSDYLNKRIVDNYIGNLNLLAAEKTAAGLAKVLRIPEALADNIRQFEAKPFISEREMVEIEVLKEQLKSAQAKNPTVVDQVLKRIELENQHAFEFIVRTYSPTAILPLQDALVNYLKNNDYIKKRMEITRTNLGLRKLKLIGESKKLDSLKKVIYANYRSMADQTRQGSNNVILSDKSVTNPLDVYSQDLSLNDQILTIDRQLYIQPDFEIVDGFTEFDEPASAGKGKIIVTGMLIGFLLGYAVVAIRKFDKYLAEIK